MRGALVFGLVVAGAGCAFPTSEFVLGAADARVTPDVPVIDAPTVDVPVVDAPRTDVPTKDMPLFDVVADVGSDVPLDAPDAAVDAASDVTAIDAGDDVPADVGSDVPADVGSDVPVDTGSDVPVDMGVDVPVDAGSDVPVDVGVDVPRDTGVDTGVDVPRDTGVDAGVDVPRDTGVDTGADTGVDVPVDSGPTPCRTTAPYCPSFTVCSAGFCVPSCPSGQTACNGACVDLRTNASNCGACGVTCANPRVCSASACTTPPGTYSFTRTSAPFIDACAIMAPPRILAGQDDVVGAPLALPFAFNFSGLAYTTLRPSSNGYVVFGSTSESHDINYYPQMGMPDANRPRPAVFVFNSDLYQRTTAGICFAVVGAAPARRAVIEWLDTAMCCGDANAAHFTFELVLNESDRSMDFIYGGLTYQPSDTRNFLVGLQNETATVGSTFTYSAAVPPAAVVAGTALHVTPVP